MLLHKEEPNDLHYSSNIVRVIKSKIMRWAGHIARMGEKRGVCSVSVGKREEKTPLGILRHTWNGNVNPYSSNVENSVSS
jgi:hypothetical protein